MITKEKGSAGKKFAGLLGEALSHKKVLEESMDKKRCFASADHSLEGIKVSPTAVTKSPYMKEDFQKFLSLKDFLGTKNKTLSPHNPKSPHVMNENDTNDNPVCPIHSASSRSSKINLPKTPKDSPAKSKGQHQVVENLKAEEKDNIKPATLNTLHGFSHKYIADHSTEARTNSKPKESPVMREKSPLPVPRLDLSSIIESRNKKNKPLADKQ